MIFAVNEHVIVCVQVSCILKHRKTRYEPETGVLSQENFSHSRILICLEGPLRLPQVSKPCQFHQHEPGDKAEGLEVGVNANKSDAEER